MRHDPFPIAALRPLAPARRVQPRSAIFQTRAPAFPLLALPVVIVPCVSLSHAVIISLSFFPSCSEWRFRETLGQAQQLGQAAWLAVMIVTGAIWDLLDDHQRPKRERGRGRDHQRAVGTERERAEQGTPLTQSIQPRSFLVCLPSEGDHR